MCPQEVNWSHTFFFFSFLLLLLSHSWSDKLRVIAVLISSLKFGGSFSVPWDAQWEGKSNLFWGSKPRGCWCVWRANTSAVSNNNTYRVRTFRFSLLINHQPLCGTKCFVDKQSELFWGKAQTLWQPVVLTAFQDPIPSLWMCKVLKRFLPAKTD